MHALLLCSFVCPNKSVCSSISSITLKSETVFAEELSRLIVPTAIPHVCATHVLTASQWTVPTAIPHVCAMHTLPKWTAPAAIPHVCAMHTLPKWTAPAAIPHVCAMHMLPKSQSALSWWTCFRQPVVFVGCFVDFSFFFLQSFLLVQTQSALQSPPKSKGGKQPVADNKTNTTQH